MATTNILIIGRNQQILGTILRLLNRHPDWNATGAVEDEDAIREFRKREYQVVLFGGGVDEHSEIRLRSFFLSLNENVRFVQHFGGGSGLLFTEIYEVLKK